MFSLLMLRLWVREQRFIHVYILSLALYIVIKVSLSTPEKIFLRNESFVSLKRRYFTIFMQSFLFFSKRLGKTRTSSLRNAFKRWLIWNWAELLLLHANISFSASWSWYVKVFFWILHSMTYCQNETLKNNFCTWRSLTISSA